MGCGVRFFLVLLLSGGACLASLIPCPDCERQVSDRAVLCPGCGCPGDAIKAAAEEAEELAAAPQKWGPVLRITTDRKSGFGVAVRDAGQNYLILDGSLLWACESLSITAAVTNVPISYHHLELAQDTSLARFRTHETNLVFLEVTDFRASNQNLAPTLPDGEYSNAPVGLIDSQTNLMALMVTPNNGDTSVDKLADQEWVRVSPKTFREQTRLLVAAKDDSEKNEGTSERLANTDWATDFLRQKADNIRSTEQTRGRK